MRVLWVTMVAMLALSVGDGGKGRKHRHHKPGREVLDRLVSDVVSEASEPAATSGGGAGDAGGASGALLPAPLDAAPYSSVDANATCGEIGPENFCREMPAKRGVLCGVCEGPEGAAARQHPAAHALDADPATWWQSPTLALGEYQHVALVVTLPDAMELLHVIIKSGPSPRPLAWSLEVSATADGDDWRMIRAFGDKDSCRRLWSLRPERRRRRVRRAKRNRTHRADKPVCSTQFSSPRPLENGEMHVGVGEGVAARRVRVSLRALHAGPPDRRFYTVRALTLAARCLCHGHGHACDITREGAVCSCGHGACGAHCERCCGGGAWRPALACGERGACEYDDAGDVLCVNCTENRAGPLCDRCLVGYYTSAPDSPCLPCDCHPQGSDGTCEWSSEEQDYSCQCREGYAGPRCDVAPPASVAPPPAPPCPCDPRGAVEGSDLCSTVCHCKAKVIGAHCDACAPGHYGLSAALADGCRRCHCSSLAATCVVHTEPSTSMELPSVVGDGGAGWTVRDLAGGRSVEPGRDEASRPYLSTYEVEDWEDIYWVTEAFNGEQLSTYGSVLQYRVFWGVVRGDAGGEPTTGPDVVLLAKDGTRIAYGDRKHETPGQMELDVPLMEGEWYELGDDRGDRKEMISREQLMDVLGDVQAIMLRAKFHLDQDEVRLEAARVSGGTQGTRERCACPAGYEGDSCTRCAWTHARIQHATGVTPRFECALCDCNGHAGCNPVTGACDSCQHQTSGARCERCAAGHYGNPARGPCSPCACPLPLPSNNFSPNCALASAEGDDYVCTQCPLGYRGDHCESCDFGYWGAPTTVGSSCRACACGGAPCDRRTGECIQCPPHAEGARCDQCEEGYWLSPDGECSPCSCGAGALSAACEAGTGACACRVGWNGTRCDSCATGHGDVSAGCPPCRCGLAALSALCAAGSGVCACATGAAPPLCDQCLPEHYALDTTGCKGCNCSSLGSESNACDIRTGQCRCKEHVTGRACDICEEGYWGLSRGGCRLCACGAGAAACDPESGACACAPGVGGAQCDACLAGFYGFGPNGCLPCPACGAGEVCSPLSGRCVCPARTRGPACGACAAGAWGRDHAGCRACSCGHGALSGECEPRSGQCRCRAGWAGRACDTCAEGHHGPRCRPCACHVPGTEDCDPDTGLCPCDTDGQCRCKENVVGAKCSECRDGTFALSADSPSGCTACFCFGRSAHCTQAGLTRATIRAAGVDLTLTADEPTHQHHFDVHTVGAIHINSSITTIPWARSPSPLYVELGERFLGDRVTSYGGTLRFNVVEDGGEEVEEEAVRSYPLVKLYSGHDLVLEYYQRAPSSNGSHGVRFHESLWSVRARGAVGGGAGGGGEGRASRAALMVALDHVTRLLLRVNTRTPTPGSPLRVRLSNVSLDTAVPGSSRSPPAVGVELCACPSPYAASSCQRPAPGFWMPETTLQLHHVAGTIVIDVEGEARPCHCNGRAAACHPDTGDCLNCTGGTAGARCDTCAEGHIGAPDAVGGCQPCPCPGRGANHASACRYSEGRLQCLCKPGYTGSRCESCAAGWVWGGGAGGAAGAAGAGCVECRCDPLGALSPACDARGRCACRDHAAGARCQLCRAHRTYMHNDHCLPCDNCTQTLLDGVEGLTEALRNKASVNELSKVPKPYPALQLFRGNASASWDAIEQYKRTMASSAGLNENMIEDLENGMQSILDEADFLRTESVKQQEKAHALGLESSSALEVVLAERAKLASHVQGLLAFARAERHLTAHRALKEAAHHLRTIKDLKLIDYVAGANDVFDSANLQSTATKEYTYRVEDTMRRVRNMQFALEHLHAKADDVAKMADAVWDAGDLVAAQAQRTKPRLAQVRETNLKSNLMLEDVTTLASHNLTEEAKAALDRASSLVAGLPALSSELESLTLPTEEKEGILYNLTPIYRHKYLEAVEKHVHELKEKAENYKRLFSGSASSAAGGVEAARAWVAVGAAVAAAAAEARAAAAAGRRARVLARGPPPLRERAGRAKAVSDEQRRRAELLLNQTDELRVELERLHRGSERVSVALRGAGWQERALAARPRADVAHTLAHAELVSDRVFATTRALHDEAAELRRRAHYQLRRRLADLQRHGDTALGAAQELVSQIRGSSLRAQEVCGALADAATARAREHVAADGTLAPELARLRANVARARHATDTISVSLSSLPGAVGCSRAYRVPASSQSVTRISLALSFDGAVADGPLLWLGAAGAGDAAGDGGGGGGYMRLRVQDRKLSLHWDLGDGEAVLHHPAVLEPAHDDAEHISYRIDIERVWSTARLWVERSGGVAGSAVTNTSGGALCTLRAPLALWLGAAGDGAGAAGALPGCVHALHYDDRRIGLWNFVTQPQGARCTGCTQRWSGSSSAGGSPSLAWFDGAGYAELQRSQLRVYHRGHFSVSLTFRTRDEDALLFMAPDAANNRSISLSLRSCRVVFRVEYSAATLEIVARGRHCLGRPVHVQAIRLFHDNLEKGSLRVNGEETLGSPEPPVQAAAALPDLAAARYWLGGAPPSHRTPQRPLLGCLGALLVDRVGYDPLDTTRKHGVEPACTDKTLRSLMVEGSGWAELPSPALRRRSALGVTFTARAHSGLVLLRAHTGLVPRDHTEDSAEEEEEEEDHCYLALVLLNGTLVLSAATGKDSTELRANSSRYDDAAPHTVRILRAHKQLELWVDEELAASGQLSGGGMAGRPRGLYLGGLPASARTAPVSALAELSAAPGFTGTIADVVVDAMLVGVESAVRWQGAALGRADRAAAETVLPHANIAQRVPEHAVCTKASSYTLEPGAVKFGDAAHSYATLKLPPKATKQLSLALQFRTFRNDGLLLLIPGSKTKPKHYLALMVREGRLQLVVRGRRRRAVWLPVGGAAQGAAGGAGTWRGASVRVGGARLVLASGGAAATARAPRKLGLSSRLYVGGLPERSAAPNLPESVYRIGGLVGCLRRVVVGGRAEDLVRSAATHRRVGQCFPNVEPAAHFSGDAYAVWSSSWQWADTLEVSLQLRTTEPHGLLLAHKHFLLEIKDGILVLSRRSAAGALLEAVSGGGGAVCDDAWHEVRARVSPSALHLTVDVEPPSSSGAPAPVSPSPTHEDPPAPLYVAGLPEGEESFGSKHNLKGCLREVRVSGEARDWPQMEALHNVLLDSCPVHTT